MNLATCYDAEPCTFKSAGGCMILSRGYAGRPCPFRKTYDEYKEGLRKAAEKGAKFDEKNLLFDGDDRDITCGDD